MNQTPAVRDLRDAFRAALRAIDLRTRTAHLMTRLHRSLRGPVVVVAIGKSAAPMLDGAIASLTRDWRCVVVARPRRAASVSDRVLGSCARAGVTLDEFIAGHPIPDAQSVAAGRAIERAVRSAGRRGNVVVLLSGGASAAACVPRPGWTLAAVRSRTRALIASDRPITRINAARAEFDALKSGGLRRMARDARLHTIVAIDIVGREPVTRSIVGSGPTAGAPRRGDTWAVVASPVTARDALADELAARGYRVRRGRAITGPCEPNARKLAQRVGRLKPGEAFVASGEVTVRVPANAGRGGRCGRLALAVASALETRHAVAILCGATDGVDGESGHAGGVVDERTRDRARRKGVDVTAALARYDDASAHEAMGTSLNVGPTGINLVDLYAAVRAPPAKPGEVKRRASRGAIRGD